ncbi:MAG: hypothetical protein JWN70_1839 [Planctomycetaceae bacterium]|nr:hypothetical protein [Planctomycetaceae bacterium]
MTVKHLSLEDRITGCLMAGALGDAIGSHFEARPTTTNIVVPHEVQVSDDTQLTIATCESIIETGSVKPESIAGHFLRWFRERRISGIGASTLKSLRELDAGGHWALVGATGEYSAGNGAAMRIAPLAFVLDPDLDKDRQIIRDVCRITHRNDEAYIGALAMVRAIRYVNAGHPIDIRLLSLLVDWIPDSRVRDRLIVVRDTSLSLGEFAAIFPSTGYVVDSVPLAILAACRSNGLLPTIQEIVQCGGDTDTVASMYGQIYGAAYGTTVVPKESVGRIDVVSLICDVATAFSSTCSQVRRES